MNAFTPPEPTEFPANSLGAAAGALPQGPSTEALLGAIATWQDLPEVRRKNLCSAIRVVDGIAKAPRFPEDAPACRLFLQHGWTCAGLNAVIWRHPPAFWKLKVGRFQTIVSAVRFVLRRLNLHADAGWRRNLLAAPWTALHGSLPTLERRNGLILFARYCVLQEILARRTSIMASLPPSRPGAAATLSTMMRPAWHAGSPAAGTGRPSMSPAGRRRNFSARICATNTSCRWIPTHPASPQASMRSWPRSMAGCPASRPMPPWRRRRHRALPRSAAAPSRFARARSMPSFTASV